MTLASCGDADNTASSDDSSDLGTIKVSLGAPKSLAYMPIEYGNRLGAWDDTGLTVEVVANDPTTSHQALAAGDADIEVNAGTGTAIAIAKGLPAKIVAANVLPSTHFMFVSNSYLNGNDVTEPADLKGATFAVSAPGSAGDYQTRRLAESMGWSESDYEIVALGDLQSITAAAQRGDVDAFSFGVPTPLQLETQGEGKALVPMKDYVPEDANSVIVASNDLVENRGPALKAFMEGYANAVRQLREDPEIAVDIMVEWGIDESSAQRAVDFMLPLFSEDGSIPQANLDALVEACELIDPSVTIDISNTVTPWDA